MRIDKFTSKFQQALSDAQSLAVGRDHSLIEPAHLLLALIDQQGGNSLPVLRQAGADVLPTNCGACSGYGGSIPDGANVIATTARNFKGRMGSATAQVYLASPYTVAASALWLIASSTSSRRRTPCAQVAATRACWARRSSRAR